MAATKTLVTAGVAAMALMGAGAAQAASTATCTLTGPMTVKSGGGLFVKGKARCQGSLGRFLVDPSRGSFEMTSADCGKSPKITLRVPQLLSWDPRNAVHASAELRTVGLGTAALLSGSGRAAGRATSVSGASSSLNPTNCKTGDLRLDLTFTTP